MKTYILFVICGTSVSNKVVENNAATFAKKANSVVGFGTNIVEIWENGEMVKNISWENFKNNLVNYI